MKKLSLALRLLATGSLTMLLAACYGVIRVMYGVPAGLSGLIKAQDVQGSSLPNILVTYRLTAPGSPTPQTWDSLGRTDSEGSLPYNLIGAENDLLEVTLTDDDGPENGGSFAEEGPVRVDEPVEVVILDPYVPL